MTSIDDHEAILDSLQVRVGELERLVRNMQNSLDTFVNTPAWKRWLFIIDGWSGHKVIRAPSWRPWRRWYRS